MRALLSAEVDIKRGRYGCQRTVTTLSSCSNVFTTSIFSWQFSEIFITLSNPALAKNYPSAEKEIPLTSAPCTS